MAYTILSFWKQSVILRIAFQVRRNYYGGNYHGLCALVFLIVYALKTRKIAESMILATLLAMVLLHRQHFLTGTIDAIYGALSNSSYQFVLCIIIGLGGMITLFQESGALMGFRDLLLKIAAGPKRTLVLAWLMSVIMFVDEYLNALTVTFSMREITDKNRIPREHLALQANIMACCLCMTIPFSSWTAFSVGWCRSTVWAFRTICGPSRTCSIRWP